MMKWSLLMATVPERRGFRRRMLESIEPQLDGRDDIELIILEDRKVMDIGTKRQHLVNIARGEYVSFIDDDDFVAPTFVERIYPLLLTGVDYVGYRAQILGANRISYTTIECEDWWEDNTGWYRGVLHVCPIKRELALREQFDSQGYGEDHRWDVRVQRHCRTEAQVGYGDDDIMYYYVERNYSEGAAPSLWPSNH